MLKKTLLAGSAAITALSLSSCLDIDTKVVTQKDGSATVTDTILIEPQALQQMQMMMSMQEKDPAKAGQQADVFANLIKPENLAAAAKDLGEGASVEKAEKIEVNGKQGVRVTYKIAKIGTLQLRPGNTLNYMMGPEKAAEAKAKMPGNKAITFTLQQTDLNVHMPQPPKAPADAPKASEIPEQQMEMAKKMMKGMRMNVEIDVPSGIAKSNAANQTATTINLASVDMDQVIQQPDAIKKLMSQSGASPSEITNALKGVPGVKFEPSETVTITFK